MLDQLKEHLLDASLAITRARGRRQDESSHTRAERVARFYCDLFNRPRVNK